MCAMTTLALLTLVVLVTAGLYLRQSSRLFSVVPLSLIAGLALLLAGVPAVSLDAITFGWESVPEQLISVVFATLFFGKALIPLREIWKFAGPQLVLSQLMAWGQYLVGGLLTLLILVPLFAANPLSAALIEIGFEGGHGTAAGMAELFEELEFGEGEDIALALATTGLVIGLVSGLLFAAIFRIRSGVRATIDSGERIRTRLLTLSSLPRLIGQLALVGLAVALGETFKLALVAGEDALRQLIPIVEIARFIPVFPLAMLASILIQFVMQKLGIDHLVHQPTMDRIGSLSLDAVILTALATMSLSAVLDNWQIVLILALGGFAWNLTMMFGVAPRLFSEFWFARGMGDFGQSMGTTATGLLLIDLVDPDRKSGAMERLGYAALLFEPILGGGLFTASSLLIAYHLGAPVLTAIGFGFVALWLSVGYLAFMRKRALSD